MGKLKRNVLSSNDLGYAQQICVPKSLSPESEHFQCCLWACVLWMLWTEGTLCFFIKWVNLSPPERLLSCRVIKPSDFQVNAQWTKGLLHFHLSKFCQINKHPSSGNNLYNSQLRHQARLKPTTLPAAKQRNHTKTKLPQSTLCLQLQWLRAHFQFLPTQALPTWVDTHETQRYLQK